jgi:hypothetical protein
VAFSSAFPGWPGSSSSAASLALPSVRVARPGKSSLADAWEDDKRLMPSPSVGPAGSPG